MLHKVYLGLGSNQGDRAAKLARAIELICERVGPVIRQSSVIGGFLIEGIVIVACFFLAARITLVHHVDGVALHHHLRVIVVGIAIAAVHHIRMGIGCIVAVQRGDVL